MADPKIKITLDKIICNETEDITGSDEFYVMCAFASQKDGNPIIKGAGTWSLNNGQKVEPKTVLFEEEVGTGQESVFAITCIDKDVASEFQETDLKQAQKLTDATIGAIKKYKHNTNEEINFDPGWIIEAIHLAFGIIRMLINMDDDDILGEDEYHIATPSVMEDWLANIPGAPNQREIKRNFKCLMDGCNYDVFYTVLVTY